MRLWELFGNLDEKSLPAIEKHLDATDYQPAEKVKADKPVIDLDLLSQPHFAQRFNQRSKSAGISPDEIEDLFHKGREKFKMEIGQASKLDHFGGQRVDFFDPASKILVPTEIAANPNCKPNSRGKFTCQTTNGPEPKNRLVAKTVMRKGTPD